jgi:hypothetical protein
VAKKKKIAKKVKKEKKVEPKKGLIEREKSADNFMKNLKAMQTLKWDGLLEELKKVPEKVVPIDNNIVYKSLRNPLVCVFIGMSTRKIIDSLRRVPKVIKYVCVIEPDISVFKHVLATEDISDLLLDPNMDFIIGKQGELIIPELFRKLTKPMADTGVTRTTIIQNMETLLDPFVYSGENHKTGMDYVHLVRQTVQQIKLSMGCPDDQFRRLELLMMNKDVMLNAWNITPLWDKFKDVPAFVLGGGPSLQEFIDNYKEKKLNNGIIIAADAVLKKLLDNGIKPHMVVRCERKLTNIFEGITREMTKGIYYCAYPWTPPEFFELFENHFYLFRQNGVCRFTEIKHGFVDGGVSSGNAALEIAFNLGCKEIYLSGLDMCMKGGKTHIDGTQVEFNIEKSKDKWTKVPTNDGKMETTIPVWERCRKEYTQAIQKQLDKGNNVTVYNTSPFGAVIPLATFKTLDKVSAFKEVEVTGKIDKLKAKLDQKEIDNFNSILVSSREKIRGYAKSLEVAKGLAEDSKRTAIREIEKIVLLSKTSARDDYEFILLLRNNKANFIKLWSGVSDQIDTNFKKKLYHEKLFTTLVFDILQGQLYHYENAVAGLVNLIEQEDQRHYVYYTTTKEFMAQVAYYLDRLDKLFG